MGSALPYSGQAASTGERAAPASTAGHDAEAPAPPDAEEGLSVTARIGDLACVTTLARPTRGWRAVEAIFADDTGLARIVVVRPSQIGGSYLIRRDERAREPSPG